MGGRITRAIYKNQRTSNKFNTNQSNNQIRAITNSFSIVISSVASFLIGYLLRPHFIDTNPKQQSNQQLGQWKLIVLGLCIIVGAQLLYVMRKRNKNDSILNSVKNNNKLSIITSITCLLINILAWFMSYRLDIIFRIVYGLLWIGLGNVCLLVISNIKLYSSKKQCKHSTTPQQQQQQSQTNNLKRTIFIYIISALLYLGLVCSQYMKNIRVDKTAKEVLSNLNKQSNTIQQSLSESIKNIQKLPVQYQSIVMDSEHDQKIMLKIMFSFLIFMIISTIIAFQKKSLLHFFVYDKNKAQLHNLYQNKILPIHKETLNDSSQNIKEISKNLNVKNIFITSVIYLLAIVLIQSQRQSILHKSIYQQSLSINLYPYVVLILSVILISYLVLKGTIYCLYRSMFSKFDRISEQSLKMKKRNTLIITTLLFILYHLTINILQYLFLNQNQHNNNLFNSILIPLGNIEILYILVTFFFIRFTKDQLIRFPQTSQQYYLTIAVTITFIIKYIVSKTTLTNLSQILIGYSARPLIRGLKFIQIFFTGDSYKPIDLQSENFLCFQLLIFIFIVALIFINDQRSFIYMLSANYSVKPEKQQQKNEPLIPLKQTSNIKNNQPANVNQFQFPVKQKIIPIHTVLQNTHQFYDESSSFLNKD